MFAFFVEEALRTALRTLERCPWGWTCPGPPLQGEMGLFPRTGQGTFFVFLGIVHTGEAVLLPDCHVALAWCPGAGCPPQGPLRGCLVSLSR